MTKFWIILIIFVGLVSCGDPGKRITLKCTSPNTSITIYGDSTIIPMGHEKKGRGILRVAAESYSSDQQIFRFGMGTWHDPSLIKFSRHIDSIVIINTNGVQRMTDSTAIQSFLKEHRSGSYQNFITIEAQ